MKLVNSRSRSGAVICGLVIVSLVGAACGSSSSTASATAKVGAASTTSTTSGGTNLVAQAKTEIAKYSVAPSFTAPGPAIDASSLKGKTILVVQHDTVAAVMVDVTNGILQAGKALGIHVQVFNGEGTVSTIQQGIQQGINEHVGAIILCGVVTSLVPSSVAAANAAKIPVIAAVTAQPTMGVPDQGFGSGLFGGSAPNFVEEGRLMADTAIAASSGSPINAAIITFDNPVARANIQGINDVFSGCSYCHVISTQDIEPQNWPTKVTGATSSLILANPKLNYIFPVEDTMSIFAAPGVSQAGASGRVSVVTSAGASLGLVQKGPIVVADPGYSPSWIGWEAMDQALRAMTGMQPGNPEVPVRYLDKSNLDGVNSKDLADANVYGNSYVAGYMKLWGLG